MEEALSAQRHIDRLNLPLVLAYGTYETPEFQRQTPRFLRGGEGGRQTGRAPGRRRLQPFRDAGDAGKSLRPARPRGAGADGIDAGGVRGGANMPSNNDLSRGRVTRRALVGGGAVVLGAGGPALAQRAAQPPRAKGPLVWLDMDQQELDDAYDQSLCAQPRSHPQALRATARSVRERLGAPKRFAYGPTPIEGLDVFTTKAAERAGPCLHPWRRLAHRAGRELRLSGRDVRQCRRALRRARLQQRGRDRRRSDGRWRIRCAARVAWVYKQRRELRRRSRAALCLAGIRPAGTSPACVLTTDWQKDFGLPPDLIKGGVCCSGMFDLKPARLSARSST